MTVSTLACVHWSSLVHLIMTHVSVSPLTVLETLHLLVLVKPGPGLLQVVVDHLLQVGQTLLSVDHGGQDVVLMTSNNPGRLQSRGLTHHPHSAALE